VQSHHHQGAHYSCMLKLQLLKQSIKIHQCVVNSVVTWLHILVGPCWCMYVALFGSRGCFNVNFNIVFKEIHLCISC
jgi:hypothetical protein